MWARPEQLQPGTPGAIPLPVVDGQLQTWRTWLVMAGRGFGKTRTGAEWVRDETEAGRRRRWAFVAATPADYRDTMVEGESGILAVSRRDFMPKWEPSKRRLTWPNGAIALCFSAEKPRALRGPQHDGAWCDELAAWTYPQDTWDNLQFGLRLGGAIAGIAPQACVTTTPRPIPLVKQLLADVGKHRGVVLSRGSTYVNQDNLDPAFLAYVLGRYEGTRLGQQELHAQLLEDNPGALWHRDQIEAARIGPGALPDLSRVAIAIDPAGGSNPRNNETGIIAGGIASCWCKGKAEVHAFIVEDLSGRWTPGDWGQRVVAAYHRLKADRIVAEVNQGGALVEANIRAMEGGKNLPYRALSASKGKFTRAEPVAALYEQGKVHHVGLLGPLEDQLCQWDPKGAADDMDTDPASAVKERARQGSTSPDRLDALVWLLTDLMLVGGFSGTSGTTGSVGQRRM